MFSRISRDVVTIFVGNFSSLISLSKHGLQGLMAFSFGAICFDTLIKRPCPFLLLFLRVVLFFLMAPVGDARLCWFTGLVIVIMTGYGPWSTTSVSQSVLLDP